MASIKKFNRQASLKPTPVPPKWPGASFNAPLDGEAHHALGCFEGSGLRTCAIIEN